MELLILLGLVAGLLLFVLFVKLLFLPFQLLGGFLVMLLLLPLLGLGLALTLAVGIPFLIFMTGMLVVLGVLVGGAWLVGGLVFGR